MSILNIPNLLGGTGSVARNYTLFDESNSESEIERARRFQRQYDYYIRDTEQIKKYLKQALLRTFNAQDINEMQLPFINIVPRVINRLSNAYLFPAERYLQVDKVEVNGVKKADEKQKKQAELFQNEVLGNSNINQRIKYPYRQPKLMDTCHVQVVWRNNRIEYDVFPSHLITVQEKQEDYLKPEAVLARYIKADDKGEDRLAYMYEDDEVKQVLNDEGKATNTEPNPYGRLTFVPLRVRETENYWGEGDTELVHPN